MFEQSITNIKLVLINDNSIITTLFIDQVWFELPILPNHFHVFWKFIFHEEIFRLEVTLSNMKDRCASLDVFDQCDIIFLESQKAVGKKGYGVRHRTQEEFYKHLGVAQDYVSRFMTIIIKIPLPLCPSANLTRSIVEIRTPFLILQIDG